MKILTLLAICALMIIGAVLLGCTKHKGQSYAGSQPWVSYSPFPASQTIQSTQWFDHAGCNCYIDPTSQDQDHPFLKSITVDPQAVNTPVNTDVNIRYDASYICGGQGFADIYGNDFASNKFAGVGSIRFEAGQILNLPNIYGIATFHKPAYQQAVQDNIHLNIDLQCWDVHHQNCSNGIVECKASIDIPVTVQ